MSYSKIFSIKNGIFRADWYILKVSIMDQSVLHIMGAVLQLMYYHSCSVLCCSDQFFLATTPIVMFLYVITEARKI